MRRVANRTEPAEGAAPLAFFTFSVLAAAGFHLVGPRLGFPWSHPAGITAIAFITVATAWLLWHVPTYQGWRLAGRATYHRMRDRLANSDHDNASITERGQGWFGESYPAHALAVSPFERGRRAVDAAGLLLLDEALQRAEAAEAKIKALTADAGLAQVDPDPAGELRAVVTGFWQPMARGEHVRVVRLADLERFDRLLSSHVERARLVRGYARLRPRFETIHAAGHDPDGCMERIASVILAPLETEPGAAEDAVAERRRTLEGLRAVRKTLAALARDVPAICTRFEALLGEPVAPNLAFRSQAASLDDLVADIEAHRERVDVWRAILGALERLAEARAAIASAIGEVHAMGHDPEGAFTVAVPALRRPDGDDPEGYARVVREQATTIDALTLLVKRLDETARTTAAIQHALTRYPGTESARPPPVFRPPRGDAEAIGGALDAFQTESGAWWVYARERGRTAEAMAALEKASSDYLGGRYAGML